jgi:hypothetical protein
MKKSSLGIAGIRNVLFFFIVLEPPPPFTRHKLLLSKPSQVYVIRIDSRFELSLVYNRRGYARPEHFGLNSGQKLGLKAQSLDLTQE